MFIQYLIDDNYSYSLENNAAPMTPFIGSLPLSIAAKLRLAGLLHKLNYAEEHQQVLSKSQ
ncbi:hypothetical protein AC626_14165 [Pseudoalteromonas rubra]|uniref:Uncharacterized protein n=1 Tax=Pseudoalteromonas rubra TaxID=43658 RepID=A0A0L0ESM8_9GAMM|nr:hypothetical protein AC626_14165 [Pseudoalteromonas rubra]